MKSIFTKHLWGILVIAISVIALSAVYVFASTAWQPTHLIGAGSVLVGAPGGGGNPAPNFDYTLSGTVLNFVVTGNVTSGGPVGASASLTITNTGNQQLNALTLSNIVYPTNGTGWNLWVAIQGTGGIAPGASGTAVFTLTGTAPTGPATISFANVACDMTPN